jgi:hypothetical protein
VAPTFDRTDDFKRDYRGFDDPAKREQVRSSLQHFIEDLTAIEEGRASDFRPGLRVKSMKGHPGILEMSWEHDDGRATFQWGVPVREGMRHVLWRRIGGHEIFGAP